MVYDLSVIDFEDFFEHSPEQDAGTSIQSFYLLLVPTYNIDTLLDNFLDLLKETHNDFRIDTAPLSDIAGYSVFGFGDREGWPTEAEGFCSQAIEVDKWMAKLTARKRAYPLGMGDVRSDVLPRFGEWRDGILKVLEDLATNGNLGEGAPGSGEALESDEEDSVESTLVNPKSRSKRQQSRVDDLEDIGGKSGQSVSLAIDFTTTAQQGPKAMVPTTSPTYTALTKQGYTIIGSHSGVKICRWTKSALRGRGSCYKYSFYGIASHLCMETTPSLSCSNKCVFCWRHGTNPVGTTWRWQIDPPEMIIDGAKQGHYKKIKMMRGVPGVRAERFQEAMRIRHCALSLVGEPIFYPHINEFVALLHREHISSFLVCNAQHPDQLAALQPVTQLYVSIDASNAESLRKIDRPLHRDYWQRFQRCLDIIREKRFRMRTVFRLTLVKGFNIDEEVEGYADLVARGLPCFVEIKGVTYCGTSTSASAGLSMQNVPFYHEIQTFVEALNEALERRGLEYGIAAEHAHSCCALIASRRFFVEGKWHTLIGYEKFFACLESGQEFSPEDYMGDPTPEWATWGKGGFDPRDERVDRKGRVIETDG
ncbi:MAG: Fe-S oxidoreductase [Ramalina farinacea]|uniref:S-adenosyl-L-methionine-dependent tRNA 4-demethylwyosine synthase n=1 Tax=Ramalina farinacea TaxID=258253 RepID=A0AA43TW59_9LECA|nr:Fe-S oxidoreductase [Ramalina farinacea]